LGFPDGMRPLRESFLVVAIVAPVLTLVYRLWDAHWHVPFDYSGDSLPLAAYTKGMIEHTWYLSNPRLAAPFGADFRDFPEGGENLHWLGLKIIGLVTHNYALTLNLYFLLSFFAIALVAYFVARYLGFGVATSCVVGVLYAFLPYHEYRGIAHLTRGVYYQLPLAVLVIIWLSRYHEDFLRTDGDKWRVRRGRIGFALGVGVLVGCTDDQYTMFMASILALIAIASALRDRDWRPLALAGVVSVVAFGTLFVNNAPYVIDRIENGPNHAVLSRSLYDQDYYALRPVNLVLPSTGHRISEFRTLAAKAAKAKSTNSESNSSSLGLIGSIGLIVGLGAAIAAALGARTRRSADADFAAQLGVINIIAILIGTIGGFAFLIALAGFTTYRTWNRVSIFIGFASLLVVAIGLERLFVYVRRRTRPRVGTVVVAVIAGVLILGGALDQVAPRPLPSYNALAARFNADETFYHTLEQTIPAHSMVFQLPVSVFPEPAPINKMGPYEQMAAYLHTNTLRWSYGGMRGRIEGDWQQSLNPNDPVSMLAQIAAVGFQGVVIDRRGYPDNAAALLAAAAPYTGAPKLGSIDNRLYYVDLTGFRSLLEQKLGDAAVKQSADAAIGNTVRWHGFSFGETTCGGVRRWATSPTSTIELINKQSTPITVSASTALQASPATTQVTINAPGDNETVPLSGGSGSWDRTLTIPPGTSHIQFSVNGPPLHAPADARPLYLLLDGYKLGGPFDSPVQQWAGTLPSACKPAAPTAHG
jgi:phosphoglycerol transferase